MTESPIFLAQMRLKPNTSIGAFTYFNYGCDVHNTRIGRYCSIGQQVIIGADSHVTDFVTTHPLATDPSGISAGMSTLAPYQDSRFTHMARNRPPLPGDTLIGNDVWIGARAIVLAGVKIGDGAVIGAGALVNQDVEPYAVVAGVPARLLRYRFEEALRRRMLALAWWDYDLSQLPHRDFSVPEAFLDTLELAIANGLPKLAPHFK